MEKELKTCNQATTRNIKSPGLQSLIYSILTAKFLVLQYTEALKYVLLHMHNKTAVF